MDAKFDTNGFLLIERGPVWKKQPCRQTARPKREAIYRKFEFVYLTCGDWCSQCDEDALSTVTIKCGGNEVSLNIVEDNRSAEQSQLRVKEKGIIKWLGTLLGLVKK